jgi:hypothetical protein
MTWFYITAPLMLLGVAIATIPVLLLSVREHRRIHGHVPVNRLEAGRAAYGTRPAAGVGSDGQVFAPVAA